MRMMNKRTWQDAEVQESEFVSDSSDFEDFAQQQVSISIQRS
jgi:hypothetical protein